MQHTTRRRVLALTSLVTGLVAGGALSGRAFGQGAPQQPAPPRPPGSSTRSNQVVGSWNVRTFGVTSTATPTRESITVNSVRIPDSMPPRGGSGELTLEYVYNRPPGRDWEMKFVISELGNAFMSGGVPVRILADGVEIAQLATGSGGEAVWDPRAQFGPRLAGLSSVQTLSATMKFGGNELVVFEFKPVETDRAINVMVSEATRIGRMVLPRPGARPSRPQGEGGGAPGQCFITAACCTLVGLSDDCFELTALRRFRDRDLAAMPGGAEDIALYYRTAPAILDAMRGDERRLLALYFTHILPSALAASLGLKRFTRWLYTDMMWRLARRYAS
jgi:hypothetical protein